MQYFVSCSACFLCWIYKRADDAYKRFEPLYTDVGVMESALHTHQQQMAQTQEELRPLHAAHAELSGEIELVSDSTENIQWGLTWVGIQCVDTRSAPTQGDTGKSESHCLADDGHAALHEHCAKPKSRSHSRS